MPHSATPGRNEHPAVYLLTKVVAGKKEKVASQSMSGALKFWGHARKGESLRIYEIFPHDRAYRVASTLTVAGDYPLGK